MRSLALGPLSRLTSCPLRQRKSSAALVDKMNAAPSGNGREAAPFMCDGGCGVCHGVPHVCGKWKAWLCDACFSRRCAARTAAGIAPTKTGAVQIVGDEPARWLIGWPDKAVTPEAIARLVGLDVQRANLIAEACPYMQGSAEAPVAVDGRLLLPSIGAYRARPRYGWPGRWMHAEPEVGNTVRWTTRKDGEPLGSGYAVSPFSNEPVWTEGIRHESDHAHSYGQVQSVAAGAITVAFADDCIHQDHASLKGPFAAVGHRLPAREGKDWWRHCGSHEVVKVYNLFKHRCGGGGGASLPSTLSDGYADVGKVCTPDEVCTSMDQEDALRRAFARACSHGSARATAAGAGAAAAAAAAVVVAGTAAAVATVSARVATDTVDVLRRRQAQWLRLQPHTTTQCLG